VVHVVTLDCNVSVSVPVAADNPLSLNDSYGWSCAHAVTLSCCQVPIATLTTTIFGGLSGVFVEGGDTVNGHVSSQWASAIDPALFVLQSLLVATLDICALYRCSSFGGT
jgi:hypothetical protein